MGEAESLLLLLWGQWARMWQPQLSPLTGSALYTQLMRTCHDLCVDGLLAQPGTEWSRVDVSFLALLLLRQYTNN